MNTYSGTLTTFAFSELSEKAKEKAHENYVYSDSFWFYDNELRATLDRFCEIFNVKMKSWEYDAYNYYYDFDVMISDKQSELCDIRLSKFISNNYSQYLFKGKYYWKTFKSSSGKVYTKSRRSKSNFESCCPLTGVCWDEDILAPIHECLDYKHYFQSYKDLIDSCLDSFFHAAMEEYKYQQSIEFFAEMCDANDWEFDENGRYFTLPDNFKIG